MASSSSSSSGIGFFGLLGILFIGLKMTGYIEWSWVWVLCPLWIPVALLAAFALITLVVLGLIKAFENR